MQYLEPNWGTRSHIAGPDGRQLCRSGRPVRTTRVVDTPLGDVCKMCLIEVERVGDRPAPRVKAADRTINCLGCWNTITVPGWAHRRKFCSTSCRNQYNRHVRYPHLYIHVPVEPEHIPCEECGTTFAARRHARFCNEKCQTRAASRRNYIKRKARICESPS